MHPDVERCFQKFHQSMPCGWLAIESGKVACLHYDVWKCYQKVLWKCYQRMGLHQHGLYLWQMFKNLARSPACTVMI